MHLFLVGLTTVSVCTGLFKKAIRQLQLIQNAAAKFLTKNGQHHSSAEMTALTS